MVISSTLLVLFASYFVVLVALSRLERSEVAGKNVYKIIGFFRAFLPSWRFFEDIGDVPELWVRERFKDSDQVGDWRPCLKPISRHWTALWVNPSGNQLLAYHSLLQLLITDIEAIDVQKAPELENSVSYRLVRELARSECRSSFFQFKVCARAPNAPASEADDILISPLIESQP